VRRHLGGDGCVSNAKVYPALLRVIRQRGWPEVEPRFDGHGSVAHQEIVASSALQLTDIECVGAQRGVRLAIPAVLRALDCRTTQRTSTPQGGAIALGLHSRGGAADGDYGAFIQLERRGAPPALCTMCIGVAKALRW